MILRRLLTEHTVGSQEQLVQLLAREGHKITQATVSRDLQVLGATKVLDPAVGERYALPAASESAADQQEQELARHMKQFVVKIGSSGNIVMLETPPGSAGPVAAALDAIGHQDVLGTIGGDDTIMVVARRADGGPDLEREFRKLLED
jgi:transcriptional regulator of arginine metabolism